MRFFCTLVVLLLANNSVLGAAPMKRSYHTHDYYVVEHDPKVHSGASLADVARSLGVEVVERAGELENHWVVRAEKPLVDLASRGETSKAMDPVLDRFDALRGRAASHLASRSEDGLDAHRVVSSVKLLSKQELHQRYKRAPPPLRPPPGSASVVAKQFQMQDPMFSQQWHIVNEENPEHMMNVVPVWEMGITGKGVISTVVDDGLDYTSEDLAQNFSPENSWDFNDHEPLPYPKRSHDRHGTRCAGQIAAGKNKACGVGIAYDSKIAGVRILSSPISDVDEAIALNYGFQNVSIYSCSWGPPDNGRALGAPNHLIKKAVLNGINNGRDGKGSIFVFASGNGGHHEDQCNYDGYTNSIYSVTVAAVDYKGQHPYYSETCAANMVVAYSSGQGQHIVTTDKGTNQCTDHHGGTSAAAPNAAGVFALAVQARPDLTWRDIQYLTMETAKMINPEDPDWETTAAGRKYSYKYGYGVLDAYKFVTAAQKWKLVKPQTWLETKALQLEGGKMDHSKHYSGGQHIGPEGVTSKFTITKEMLAENNFESLEHINVQVWIDHTRRGDVEVELISPNGVKSILGKKRSGDDAHTGFPGWVFMTVKHWGENPVGDWTIRVTDQDSPDESGKFLGWRMKFWGSTIDPSKAEKYELPLVDNVLPPVQDPYRPALDIPNTTKEHPKPTAFLTETTRPTPTAAKTAEHTLIHSATSSLPAPTSVSTFLADVTNTVKAHKPFFGGIALICVVSVVAGIFFWRQRRKHLQQYETLEENPQMASLAPPYPNDTEHLGVSPGRHPSERASVGLGFHSSFLDDEDLSTAGVASAAPPRYRDEPEDPPPPMSSRLPPPEIRVTSS